MTRTRLIVKNALIAFTLCIAAAASWSLTDPRPASFDIASAAAPQG